MKSFPKICFLLISALALSLPSFAQEERVSYGDTIFHANFGTGLNPDSVYRDFAAASLSPLNHISPLYGYYTPTWINGSELNSVDCSGNKMAFYAGDYAIISNSHAMAYNSSTGSAYSLYNANGCKSGSDNKYLVGCANFTDLPLLDHTSGDGDGGYMIVNGSAKAGAIFIREINEICKNSQFEFSAWVAYAHNKNLKSTRLQFEIYSDDPGDAILPDDDAAASLTPGPVEMIVKQGQDPVVRNLLYKSLPFAPTTSPRDTTIERTVTEEISATTSGDHGVFTDGAGNYAYADASNHYFSTAPVLNKTGHEDYSVWYTFAEGGERKYSSTDFGSGKEVYVVTSGTSLPVYLSDIVGDTICYDASEGKYFMTTRSGAALVKDGTNEVDASHANGRLQAKASNGEYSYPLYYDGISAYAVYDGANYLLITAGSPSATEVNVPECTFSSALPDQSSVFSTAYKYNSNHTTSVTVSNPQSRWTSFVDVFRLGNYEHCYLVLRNLSGGNKDNDFAVDDIVFRPYSPFAIVPSRIEASVANACVTGIVSLKTNFAEGTTDEEKAAVAPYITDYGFRFQGSKDGGSTWEDLPGQETPLQLSDINATLEYDIPVSDYNSYNEFRIVVASTPAGFASKCVSFSSFNYDVESVSAIPDFYILGEDICVTDTTSNNDTYGKECGLFKVVRKTDASDYATCSEHPFWQIIVQLPDGSTKTLVPDQRTDGNKGTTTYDNCSYD